MRKMSTKAFIIAGATVLTAGVFAAQAFADCDDGQETAVGKAVAAAASTKITGLVTAPGKQMITLDTCDAVGGGTVAAEFKYNVIGSDGLYWLTGKAKVAGSTVNDLKILSTSPNLAAASAKAGVKLASN